MKTKKIFSLSLAKELVRRGFKIIDVEPNIQKPSFKVFIFEDTNKLQIAITEIMAFR